MTRVSASAANSHGPGSLKIGHLPEKIGIEQPLGGLSREVDCCEWVVVTEVGFVRGK
jgi:hypothetical protein